MHAKVCEFLAPYRNCHCRIRQDAKSRSQSDFISQVLYYFFYKSIQQTYHSKTKTKKNGEKTLKMDLKWTYSIGINLF